MKRTLVLALAAAATLFGATSAQAAHVNGSVGIDVPAVGVAFAPSYGGPAYAPQVAYAPQPRVIVEPAPFYAPRPVFYAPRPRFWLPPAPPLPFFGHDGWHDGGHWHHDDRAGWRR